MVVVAHGGCGGIVDGFGGLMVVVVQGGCSGMVDGFGGLMVVVVQGGTGRMVDGSDGLVAAVVQGVCGGMVINDCVVVGDGIFTVVYRVMVPEHSGVTAVISMCLDNLVTVISIV